MTEKLTHDEHHARAMLMGLEYDWHDGTYCTKAGTLKGTVITCDTLEPVDDKGCVRRHKENGSPEWLVTPPRETPWARE